MLKWNHESVTWWQSGVCVGGREVCVCVRVGSGVGQTCMESTLACFCHYRGESKAHFQACWWDKMTPSGKLRLYIWRRACQTIGCLVMVAFAQVAHVNTMACLQRVLHCAHAQIFAENSWIYNHTFDLGSRTLAEQKLEDQTSIQTINLLYQWMCSHCNKKFKQLI